MGILPTTTRWTLPVAALAIMFCTPIWSQAAAPSVDTKDLPRGEGIWKAVVPPKPMKAEFDGFDPVGVAAGARIKADCSLNWINPDDGLRYCFSSGTSLQFFQDRPHAMIERARNSWRRMNADPK